MEAKTYNGWSNYETWVTALWLDNDESTYRQMRDLAQDAWREAPQSRGVQEWKWSRDEAAANQLAELIRDLVEEHNPVHAATLYADLMYAALCEVNWSEIARHYIADYAIEEEENKNEEEQHDAQRMEEKESK